MRKKLSPATGCGKDLPVAGPLDASPAGPANPISTYNEKHLHASLKEWYAREGDLLETAAGGYIADIRRGDLLIEIQTRGFSALKNKLTRLLADHPVRLVYPVAGRKWIVRLAEDGTCLSRRRSPKKGGPEDLFKELVALPHLLLHPRFEIELLLIEEEELRCHDERKGWRRGGWVITERRLLSVQESRVFRRPADLAALLPSGLPEPFSCRELSLALGRPLRLAQRMVYCLRRMDCLEDAGKKGRALLYRRASPAQPEA